MRTIVRCAALLGLVPLFAAGLEAQDGSTQSIPLTYTPLTSPETILSRPTEKDPLGEKDAAALKRIEFKGKRSVTIDLCGETVSLVAGADGSVSARVGSREQLLRPVPRLGTIQSAHLVFGEARKYMLAFPTRSGAGVDSSLTYRSGAAQVASINGESIWFYDHNTDGTYAVGDDAVRVGDPTKVAVFAPLSSYLATAGGVYEIGQLAEDGSELHYRKYSGATGRLDVRFSGGSAEMNLVIASADGLLSTVITTGAKARPPITLIPGHYEILAAIITAPAQGTVVAVLDGSSMPSIDITDGQTTPLELGAPLALQFKADLKSSTQVNIDGSTVKVRGKAGETYSFLQWNGQPDVSLISGGAMRKLNKFSTPQGQSAGCYTSQIPEIKGHARVKIVINGMVDGLGSIRGESSLD